MTAFIYALLDPNTNERRYIGKTVDCGRRIKQHLTDASNKSKKQWIDTLRENSQLPVFEVVEECELKDWEAREIFHIESERQKGSLLLNVQVGGKGIVREQREGLGRFHLFFDEETINLLQSEKRNYGFSTLSSFIRYIIIKFFDKK